jgi:hypothetical protein
MSSLAGINKGVKTSLYQLTDEFLKSFSPIALQKKTSLTNNISPKINIGESVSSVASVIKSILEAVVNNAVDSNIIVSAREMYSKMVEVNIKDENCYGAYALALSLQNVVMLAKKTGGQLFITHQQKKVTTITFRFPVSGEDLVD